MVRVPFHLVFITTPHPHDHLFLHHLVDFVEGYAVDRIRGIVENVGYGVL